MNREPFHHAARGDDPVGHIAPPVRIEFPSLTHFAEDVADAGIEEVRVDLFEDWQASELSFVYYVSLMLYVTAEDDDRRMLYQFTERLETVTTTEREIGDELALRRALDHVQQVANQLSDAGFRVAHGRFTVDNM